MASRLTGVVVGVDGSASSRDAVRLAAAEAARRHVPLHLLRVVQSPLATGLTPYTINTGELLAAARADLDERAGEHRLRQPGLEVTVAVTFGSPPATLIEASRSAE